MSEQVNKVARQGRVPFLRGLANFRDLIDSGHTLRSIYDNHKAQLEMSYSQFTRYVSKYIPGAKQLRQNHGLTLSTPTPISTSIQHIRPLPSYFHHDPNSGNNRQDLI